jgi:hypothetical protein
MVGPWYFEDGEEVFNSQAGLFPCLSSDVGRPRPLIFLESMVLPEAALNTSDD